MLNPPLPPRSTCTSFPSSAIMPGNNHFLLSSFHAINRRSPPLFWKESGIISVSFSSETSRNPSFFLLVVADRPHFLMIFRAIETLFFFTVPPLPPPSYKLETFCAYFLENFSPPVRRPTVLLSSFPFLPSPARAEIFSRSRAPPIFLPTSLECGEFFLLPPPGRLAAGGPTL